MHCSEGAKLVAASHQVLAKPQSILSHIVEVLSSHNELNSALASPRLKSTSMCLPHLIWMCLLLLKFVLFLLIADVTTGIISSTRL